ncbi:MAG: VOC family protein [Gemmatimonadetes bacterium]|nr:VOC family protein [Gemmatimonadota bacterium]
MDLGAFSISLTVKDLNASRAFYEKLGFEATGGSEEESYLILMNGEALIGLFQGMFDKNILTFNPGLTNRKERLEEFTDVREIQRSLKEQGIEVMTEVDEDTTGAGSLTLVDPDGNPVLIDQFF